VPEPPARMMPRIGTTIPESAVERLHDGRPSPTIGDMGRSTHAGMFRVRFVAALTVMYVFVVLVVTLWPTTVDNGLDPYINRLLAKLWSKGVPTFVDYGFIEFSANIVFFVPVGFLLGVLLSYRFWWLAPIGGGLLSAAVETAQRLFLPGRVSSFGDVVANTSGALVGCLVAVAVRMLILHRDTLVIRDVLEGRRASNGLPVRK
jgi:glycopeptide antibiotics resistance protein